MALKLEADYQVNASDQWGTEARIQLSRNDTQNLADVLRASVLENNKEMRVYLPDLYDNPSFAGRWMLVWKQSPSRDNRCMLAHPSPDEWVGMVSLNKQSLEKLISSIKSMQSLSISDLGPIGGVCNFHVVLTHS